MLVNRFALFLGILAVALCVAPVDGQEICGCVDPCSCEAACDPCADNWLCPCPGITGGAEIVWMRYQDSYPDSNSNAFQTGSRYTLGYMFAGGRELRVRYFELEVEGDTDPFWRFETLDIEYAGRFQLGRNWRGDLSIGVRDASYREGGDNYYEDTIGPVLGLHLETNLLWEHLNLFTNARCSHQFGMEVEDDELGSFSIAELQVGLELNRPMMGGEGFVRGAFETQQWLGVDDGSSEDGGLIGFGVGLGFTR